MVQEDDDRPPCLIGGGGASEKELLTRGATPSASSVSYSSTNDSGNNNDGNTQNQSSPSRQAIGSKMKGSPRSTLPLSPHKASGRKLSLLNDHSHTNTSSYCSSLLSTPIQVASQHPSQSRVKVCTVAPDLKFSSRLPNRWRATLRGSKVLQMKVQNRNLLPYHNGTAVLMSVGNSPVVFKVEGIAR
jgi:hypothetical protein